MGSHPPINVDLERRDVARRQIGWHFNAETIRILFPLKSSLAAEKLNVFDLTRQGQVSRQRLDHNAIFRDGKYHSKQMAIVDRESDVFGSIRGFLFLNPAFPI